MPGNTAASSRTCSRTRCAASRRAPCTRTPRRCSATILREHWLQARAVVGFFPCNAVDEEIEVYSDTTRSRVLHRLHHLRQQKGKPAGPAALRAVGFHRAEGFGQGGLHRRVRRHRRHRHRDASRALQGGARRLQRHPAEVAGGSPGRSFRRSAAPARAPRAVGLRARRAPDQRAADRRRSIAASVRRRDIPPARITPRRARCGRCSTSSAPSTSGSPRASRCIPRPRSAAGISRIRMRSISRSGPIDLDQMQHYAARKGWSAAEARKWLVSNLENRVTADPHDEAA